MSVIYGNPIIAGGGGLELVANVVDGATVTATLGSKTVTGVSVGGQARLKIPQEGKWTVSATNGTMVSVPQEVSVPATVDLALPSHVLNDTSWAIIKQMSDAGEGANFWAVGDCKEVTMNGKVSDGLTLTNYTTWVFIIGFNHNAEREGNGIAFQGFKTAQTNGKDMCLIDSFYNNSVPSGSTALRMNNSRTSAGGWKSCKMRTIVMPLIEAALPSDLQSVLKSTTIYTDNTGNGVAGVTPTSTDDKIYILTHYEVFGTVSSNTTNKESAYCKQYDYYAAGNDKRKYRSDLLANATWWLLRSPNIPNGEMFRAVDYAGNPDAVYAGSSYGVAPCFKV